MKVPSIIIVVGAALALAVPSGYAATARTAPEVGHSAKSGASIQTPAFLSATIRALQDQLEILTVKNAALAHKNKALAAQIRALEARHGQSLTRQHRCRAASSPLGGRVPEKATESSTASTEEAASRTGIPATNRWHC